VKDEVKENGKNSWRRSQKAISKEQVKKLYESGELGPTDSLNPAQLQTTAWLYLGLFFGRRGRENPQCFLYEKLHKGLNTRN